MSRAQTSMTFEAATSLARRHQVAIQSEPCKPHPSNYRSQERQKDTDLLMLVARYGGEFRDDIAQQQLDWPICGPKDANPSFF